MTLQEAWDTIQAVGTGGVLLLFIIGLHRGWWVMKSEYTAALRRAETAETRNEQWEALAFRQLEATKSIAEVAERHLK